MKVGFLARIEDYLPVAPAPGFDKPAFLPCIGWWLENLNAITGFHVSLWYPWSSAQWWQNRT